MSDWREAKDATLGDGWSDGRRFRVAVRRAEDAPRLLRGLAGRPWRPVYGDDSDGINGIDDSGVMTDAMSDAMPDASEVLLDLRALDGLRSLDPDSGVAHVEAGLTWDALGARLAPRGFTVGPIPRWLWGRPILDTLAAPHVLRPSPRYGPLRDALLGVRSALPTGLTRTAVAPRRATGPDLGRVPLGAAHRAGLITDVHLRVWPLPAHQAHRQLRFRGWSEAREAAIAAFADGVRPAWWCLHRIGREVALTAGFDGPRLVGQLARFDAATAAGRRDPDAEAEAFAAERLPDPQTRDPRAKPTPLTPVRRVAGSDLASGVKGITRAEVWDLRPEGATVYVARDEAPPAADPDWRALESAVFAALADGGGAR